MKYAALLAALFLAACQSEPVPISAGPPSPVAGPIRGIDMATDSSDVAAELQGRRWLNFVARYYRDPTSRWPALSAAEAQRLSATGMKIVTVWEWHSSQPEYFSYASGYTDALAAYRQARTIGQPPGSAIYFAVDFNARGAALYQIDQYFRGVNAGFAAAGGGRSPYRIGVYGSGAVCAQIKGEGLAQYAWLSGSTSWDGTAGYTAWNIKQAPAAERFANLSFSHDANEATPDYGGFQLGAYAGPPTPVGMAVTAAAQAPVAAATLVQSAVTAVVPKAEATPPLPPPPHVAAAGPPPPAAPAPAVAPMSPSSPPARALAALNPIAPAEAAAPKPADAGVMDLASLGGAAGHHATAELEERPSARHEGHTAKKEELSHEEAPAHAAKALAAPKRRGYAIATNKTRVAANAPRNPGGSSHGEFHERGHRVSAPRRSEDHGAHLQARRPGTVPLLH